MIYKDNNYYRLINNPHIRSNVNGKNYYCSQQCIYPFDEKYHLGLLNKYLNFYDK